MSFSFVYLTPLVEWFLISIYLVLGPGFWALYGWGLFKSLKKMRLLRDPPDKVPDPPPPVTILIPAKDEGDRIRLCVDSVLKQDYPNYNVIVIDDRSKDRTGAILDEYAAADSRLKVIHLHEGDLPARWTGKNHALHVGSQQADGSWLLFIDADVILYPQALPLTLGIAACRRYDLVSLMPRMEFHSFWEGVVTPLGAFAAAMVHLAALTNTNSFPRNAFANGQFMLFKRKVYDEIGGHERVRDVLGEDTALARILKRNGYRPRVTWGADLCQVRMYDSLSKILRGWSRILFATAESVGRNVIGLIGTLLLCYSMVPATLWGINRAMHPLNWHPWGSAWLAIALLHWVLMTVMLGAMYALARTKIWYSIVFIPLSGPLLIYMLSRSIYLGISKRVEWRGTRYAGASATVANAPR